MTPERWEEVKRVLDSVLPLDPDGRVASLADLRARDPSLHADVQTILEYESTADFLEHPVVSHAPLQPGARLGPYRILGPLGSGGMGEVYKATDTRLDRTVAIKVLPEDLAADPERRARFEREAKTISSLSHRHICALHDIGHQDGLDYLVLEHLEGQTLGDRLRQGPLPLDMALRYAIEIAGALDEAHRQGIVHRDLKPGNIFLAKTGAKLLDFGLAKLASSSVDAELTSLSALPTQEQPLTGKGMIVGTVQYMAPEQLEGQPADARTDIFAFGAVLYEMVAGRRPFVGKSQLSVMSAIRAREPPPIRSLRDMTPPALERIVNTCLAKDPDDRWQSASDVARQLAWVTEKGPADRTGETAPRPWQRPVPVLAAVLLAVAVGGLASLAFTGPAASTPARLTRMSIVLPPAQERSNDTGRSVAISPSSSHVAYVANDQLYQRPLGELDAQPIGGTEGSDPQSPFYSPDGQWVGFYSARARALQKVPLDGGPPTTLWEGADDPGASWGPDDTVVFAVAGQGILRVAGTGGPAEVLVPVAPPDEARLPQMLSGGAAVLYTLGSRGASRVARVVVENLDTGDRTVVLENVAATTGARYVSSGHLVYAVGYGLWVAPFDIERLEVTGGAVPLIDGLDRGSLSDSGTANFDVSPTGDLAYLSVDSGSSRRTVVWVDSAGREEPLPAPARAYIVASLSPDGRRLALSAADEEEDIWVLDLERDTFTRLTTAPELDGFGIWTPDGQRIVFGSRREGEAINLYWRDGDGTGAVERLTSSPNDQLPWAISPDGSRLVFVEINPASRRDLHVLSLEAERRVAPLIATEFEEDYPRISPDGRWLAYHSDASGRDEIYVQPFPDVNDGRWQISPLGGRYAAWGPDGRELFYWTGDGVVRVPIDDGPGFGAGPPELVFDWSGYVPGLRGIAPDGRMLVLRSNDPTDAFGGLVRLHVVLDWAEELKVLVPSGE